MRVHTFESALVLPLRPEELFPFFGDAANLDAITPSWLHFRIVTPGKIAMGPGTLIDYRLRVRGIPLKWRTRINVWEPPHRFVDEQLKGSYRQWIHEHEFERCDGGTRVMDRVRYAVPLDWLVHRWFVRPDVERIFRYREEALRKRFG